MMNRSIVFILCFTAFTGCSTAVSKPMPLFKEVFDKQQFGNGVEIFTYKIFFPAVSVEPVDRGNRAPPKTVNAKSLRLGERLAIRLEAENYCADGYRKLEQVIGFENARIRGECL